MSRATNCCRSLPVRVSFFEYLVGVRLPFWPTTSVPVSNTVVFSARSESENFSDPDFFVSSFSATVLTKSWISSFVIRDVRCAGRGCGGGGFVDSCDLGNFALAGGRTCSMRGYSD